MADMALTPKQLRWIEEYQVDLNATQAAARAGYSARTANRTGARMLSNAVIMAAVRTRLAARSARISAQADDVLRELLRIAYSDIGDVLDFAGDAPRLRSARDIPDAARRCVSSMKVRRYTEGRGDNARDVEVTEFKLWDKLSALDKLARHLGLLKDGITVHLPPIQFVEYVDAPPRTDDVGDAAE